MSRYLRRGLAAALIGATGAGLGAVAAPGGAAQVDVGNACHYSYDGSWRSLALQFDATTTLPDLGNGHADGQTVMAGTRIAVEGGTVAAVLPAWLGEFAWTGGLLREGLNTFPLSGEMILEATNTAERYVRVSLHGSASITVSPGAGPGGSTLFTPFLVDNIAISPASWTATGGRVVVRQATGHALREVPGGHPTEQPAVPEGSGYVFLTMANGLHFRLQCLPGEFDLGGDSHRTALAPPLSVTEVPGFRATVAGAPLAAFDQVRADVIQRGAPPQSTPRDPAWDLLHNPGDPATLEADLHLGLDGDQIWALAQRLGLGAGAHTITVGGQVALSGQNAAPAATSVALQATPIAVTVGADAGSTPPATAQVPLSPSTWTQGEERNVPGRIRVGADAALPGGGAVHLNFSAGAAPAVEMGLTRLHPQGVSTPVAEINPTAFMDNSWDNPPGGEPEPGGPPALDPPAGPPTLDPPGGAPPPPAPPTPPATGPIVTPPPPPPTPPRVTLRRVASVPTGRLSGDRRHRVAVRVRCVGNALCRGTLRLETVQRLRLGARRPARINLGRVAYSVPAGRTRVVRVTLPRGARTLFTPRRPQLAARVTLTPRRGEGVSRTVRRAVRPHAVTRR